MTPHTPLAVRLMRLAWSLALGLVAGALCGLGSFVFLALLERATAYRLAHEPIVFALPLAGLAMGFAYERFGADVKAGTNAVIDRLAEGGAPLPLRMAPMVLLGTVTTHLFGGSAGREGTAVQMGASLADFVAQRLGLTAARRHEMLVAGVAGGFGSVFGTPLAGAVFALEFVRARQVSLRAAVPAVVAAVSGDVLAQRLGVTHAHYTQVEVASWGGTRPLRWMIVAVAVAGAAMLFVDLLHAVKKRAEALLPRLPVRMFVGGVLVVTLWRVFGTGVYLGLSDGLVARALVDRELPLFAWALKLVFTALTLGVGFVGGEVTPLFVVGATLGNTLARTLTLPLELTVAVCFASVFGVAARAPLALAVMAGEVFGVGVLPLVFAVSVVAAALTGSRTIYGSQREG